MQPENVRNEMTCPMNGKLCSRGIRSDFELLPSGKVVECRWWTHVAGKDPQTEKILDHFDCAMAWIPVVTLETSQMTRMGTQTVQDFRNEFGDMGGKIRASFGDMVNAFLHLAETNRELLEFKRKEPSVLEIPTNGKDGEEN